jgi:hypothetical protein
MRFKGGKGDTLVRIDPRGDKTAGSPLRVGTGVSDVTTGFGSVWVASSGDNDVARIAP